MADDGAGGAAFDSWVQAVAPRLLRVSQLLIGDRRAAEKALTGALAESWRSWSGGATDTGPEDVALRELVVAAKRSRRTSGSSDEPGPGALPEGLGSSDRSDVLARGALRRQLAAMPAELRAVVVLRHAEELPVERVATVLGEPVEQVERAEEAALVLLARDEALRPYVASGAA